MLKFLKSLIRSFVILSCVALFVASCATLYESFLYDHKGRSVVKLTRTDAGLSGGTGFQIRTRSGARYTLTNAHICEVADTLVAHSEEMPIQRVHVVEIDKEHDLCIMTPVMGLPVLDIASSIDMHERVWLIGHPSLRPLTLESGHYAGDVTIQLLSQCPQDEIDKRLKEIEEEKKKGIQPDLREIMQLMYGMCPKPFTSQYINNIAYGGNSGSPVLNKFGNVVGVLFAGRRDQPTASYTVPLSAIHDFLFDK